MVDLSVLVEDMADYLDFDLVVPELAGFSWRAVATSRLPLFIAFMEPPRYRTRCSSTSRGGNAMKATTLRAVLVLGSLLIAAACERGAGSARDTSKGALQAGGPTNDAAVRAAVDSANRKFEAAFKSGDVATTSSFYEDSAVSRHAHLEPMVGRAAIESGFGEFLKMVGTINTFSVQRQELDIYPDHLVEIGTYSMSFTPTGAKDPIRDRGSYLNYWRKQPDGSWKIHRDVDVSAMPLPNFAPPAAAKK